MDEARRRTSLSVLACLWARCCVGRSAFEGCGLFRDSRTSHRRRVAHDQTAGKVLEDTGLHPPCSAATRTGYERGRGRIDVRRLVAFILATIAALVVWAVLVVVGTREGWWRPLPAPHGDTAGFIATAKARFAAESKGDIALALLVKGRVAGTLYISHGRFVDGSSLFQVASMSKWITAGGVMHLVEQGRIDLDAPISRCLKRWKLPPSQFDNNGATVRRVLAHVFCFFV